MVRIPTFSKSFAVFSPIPFKVSMDWSFAIGFMLLSHFFWPHICMPGSAADYSFQPGGNGKSCLVRSLDQKEQLFLSLYICREIQDRTETL